MSITKQLERERVAHALKEAEFRVRNCQDGLDQVNKDIIFLDHLERQLSENIEVLKNEEIVTLAPEYKKIKHELTCCRILMKSKRKDQKELLTAVKNAQDYYKQMKSHHDNVLERQENNILYGNFGRKPNG